MGNRLLHSLKEIFGADEHNLILGIKAVFLVSISFAAMQCPCKPPIVMRCRHRRPKESNMHFPWLPVEVALSIFNPKFFVKSLFWKDFMKTKDIVNYEL